MACMFNLRNIFELIVDGFNDRPFSQQNFIDERHQSIFHVGFQPGHQLNASLIQAGKQGLGDIAAVAKEFSIQAGSHIRDGKSVIHIAWSDFDCQELPQFIDDEVDFQAIKPSE